jgi:hypothetical protein
MKIDEAVRLARQVETSRTMTQRIMEHPNFERGLNDARRGQPFDWRIDDDYCAYERGRQFANLAPINMPLRINGELNRKAVALCDAAFTRSYMV